MASTQRSSLARVLEVTKGTTPSNPAFTGMRETSNTLAYTPSRVTSAEIRADRQVADQILVDLSAGGDVPIELSYGAFDDLFEAAFQGTWAASPSRDNAGTPDSVITAVATTNTEVTHLTGAALVLNHLVRFTGFGVAGNNGLFKCTQGGTTSSRYAGSGITDESAPPAAAKVKVVGFVGDSGDLTASSTGLASSTLDFTTLGLTPGMWLWVGGDGAGNGFATAACAGWARVSAIAAHALTFDILPTGWTTDTGTGKTVQVFFGDFLVNGTTQRAFTFERQQQDLASPSYEYFRGMQVDQLSLAFKSASIITGSVTLLGLTAAAGTSRVAGATDVAAASAPVLNAAANVGALLQDGAAIVTSAIEEIDIGLKNNLARETAVGVLGAVNIRNGELDVSGTLSAYFNDLGMLSKVLADTPTALMLRTGRTDDDHQSYLFDLPQVKLSGTSPVSAKNASRMFSGSYDAYRHPTLGYTIAAGRYPYLPAAAH